MDNYQAIAYVVVSFNELRKSGKEINKINERIIQREMVY